MLYKSRYLNQDDVVIYNSGPDSELAAVRIRVPIPADFIVPPSKQFALSIALMMPLPK